MLIHALKALGKSFLIVTAIGFGVVKALDTFAAAEKRDVPKFATHDDLAAAMEKFSRSLNDDIERRFEVQNRSVQSLRTMVARTDELLEQVLESIESGSSIHA